MMSDGVALSEDHHCEVPWFTFDESFRNTFLGVDALHEFLKGALVPPEGDIRFLKIRESPVFDLVVALIDQVVER